MARTFNGTSHSLQSAATIDLTGATTLTVAFWMYWDAFANDDDLAFESSANYNNNPGAIIADANEASTTKFVIAVHDSGVTSGTNHASGQSFTRPSAAAWHHYLVTFDLGSTPWVKNVWIDGVAAGSLATFGTGSSAAPGFGNYTWNFMSRNNASLFGAGRIAEFAIFGGVLLNINAAKGLTNGADVLDLQPTHDWKCMGDDSPEPNWGTVRTALTVNSATKANHAQVDLFSRRFWQSVPEPSIAGSVFSPHYYHELIARAA